MSRHLLAFVLLAALAAPLTLSAHEGHDHKVLGTIVSVDAKQLVVKTTEGRSTCSLPGRWRVRLSEVPARS